MHKKLITSAAIAATLVGTMAPAILASAATDTNPADVKVTYNNETGIVTDADYMITVPAAINFVPGSGMTVDAHVDMYELDGKTAYAGEGSADVTVKSENDFQMKHETEDEKLPYFLRYEQGGLLETGKGTAENAIGSYSNAFVHNEGTAHLKQEGTHKGLYSDMLTYTITDTTEVPDTK